MSRPTTKDEGWSLVLHPSSGRRDELVRKRWNLLETAARNLLRHGMRSTTVILCLVAMWFPILTASALSEGIRRQAEIASEAGSPLYVTADAGGKNGPVPFRYAGRIEALQSGVRVIPRVVARTYFGETVAVVVGLPLGTLRTLGSFTGTGHGQAILGSRLAKQYKVDAGDRFTLYTDRVHLLKIAGILPATASIWSQDVILMPLRDAMDLFGSPERVSGLSVYCDPEDQDGIVQSLQRDTTGDFRIRTKDLTRHQLQASFTGRRGIFIVLYTIGGALSIPIVLMSAGWGSSERRRETGILRAIGWRRPEVLEMVAYENLLLCLTGMPFALSLSVLCLRGLNGAFVLPAFLSESELIPQFPVPVQFTLTPVLAGVVCALALTMIGSFCSSWRAVEAMPAEYVR